MKKGINNKKVATKIEIKNRDELLPEYNFKGARPNPYSGKKRVFIELSPEVAKVFKTAEEVNHTLRAIITTFPQKNVSKKIRSKI
jgi:hypothetical protein